MNNKDRLISGIPLNEHIADEPSLNVKINTQLENFSKADQTRILDALDALKRAGKDGLSVIDWARYVQLIHKEDRSEILGILKICADQFSFCVTRLAPKQYVFTEPTNLIKSSHPVEQSKKQIGLTFVAMNAMKEMGSFSKHELIAKLEQSGFPQYESSQYVDHLLNVFNSTLDKLPSNRYRMRTDPYHSSEDSMNVLRDIAKNSGK